MAFPIGDATNHPRKDDLSTEGALGRGKTRLGPLSPEDVQPGGIVVRVCSFGSGAEQVIQAFAEAQVGDPKVVVLHAALVTGFGESSEGPRVETMCHNCGASFTSHEDSMRRLSVMRELFPCVLSGQRVDVLWVQSFDGEVSRLDAPQLGLMPPQDVEEGLRAYGFYFTGPGNLEYTSGGRGWIPLRDKLEEVQRLTGGTAALVKDLGPLPVAYGRHQLGDVNSQSYLHSGRVDDPRGVSPLRAAIDAWHKKKSLRNLSDLERKRTLWVDDSGPDFPPNGSSQHLTDTMDAVHYATAHLREPHTRRDTMAHDDYYEDRFRLNQTERPRLRYGKWEPEPPLSELAAIRKELYDLREDVARAHAGRSNVMPMHVVLERLLVLTAQLELHARRVYPEDVRCGRVPFDECDPRPHSAIDRDKAASRYFRDLKPRGFDTGKYGRSISFVVDENMNLLGVTENQVRSAVAESVRRLEQAGKNIFMTIRDLDDEQYLEADSMIGHHRRVAVQAFEESLLFSGLRTSEAPQYVTFTNLGTAEPTGDGCLEKSLDALIGVPSSIESREMELPKTSPFKFKDHPCGFANSPSPSEDADDDDETSASAEDYDPRDLNSERIGSRNFVPKPLESASELFGGFVVREKADANEEDSPDTARIQGREYAASPTVMVDLGKREVSASMKVTLDAKVTANLETGEPQEGNITVCKVVKATPAPTEPDSPGADTTPMARSSSVSVVKIPR